MKIKGLLQVDNVVRMRYSSADIMGSEMNYSNREIMLLSIEGISFVSVGKTSSYMGFFLTAVSGKSKKKNYARNVKMWNISS